MKAKINGTNRVLEQSISQATCGYGFDYIQLDFHDFSLLMRSPDPLQVLATLYTRMVIPSEVLNNEQ